MKKIILNSSLAASVVTLVISFWIIAKPVPAFAASSSAICANGESVTCQAANSQCFGIDSMNGTPGGCICISNDPNIHDPTDKKECTDSDEVPYIN